MEYLVICAVALLASGLTLFSGFGLGTLLMPTFAFFFPVEIAISLTSIVHLLNNIFKLLLFRKNVNVIVAVKFGVPAVIAAWFGAWILFKLSEAKFYSFSYNFGNLNGEITPIKLVLAVLIILLPLLK
jgi:uncharacterized membrane protein YfcA